MEITLEVKWILIIVHFRFSHNPRQTKNNSYEMDPRYFTTLNILSKFWFL
jgi:hypothetical protein